jgi:hypothetical protein
MTNSQVDIDWKKIANCKIAAIEHPVCDRDLVLKEIARRNLSQSIYYWNFGLEHIHLYTDRGLETLEQLSADSLDGVLKIARTLEGVLILEGIDEIRSKINYKFRNFYFDHNSKTQLILTDNSIDIPDNLYSLIPKIKVRLPNVLEIKTFLSDVGYEEKDFVNFIGLSYGEIVLVRERKLTFEEIFEFKTTKLSARGLSITPKPEVSFVGGLDLLLRDLNKIEKLFLPSARERGLRPPKGCLLWGLPGTGKSLTAKMLSQILNVPLISCNWNQLVSSNLSESLQNIDLVFQLVDSIGACIIFFDEFEKAFFGWNSGEGGGVMAKMAGYLLSWLQDHESPSIMVATINRIDMLPPELIRRFEYIWFFDINLHNGAMYEIFQIHLDLHFPEFCQKFTDNNWYKLFATYRSCSPAEIAGAVRRVHDEIFYQDLHHDLQPQTILNFLLEERTNFKPAASDRIISDQLAKIRRTADFARPVQGKDCSKFATQTVELFSSNISRLPENYTLAV